MEDPYGQKLDQGRSSMRDLAIMHSAYWKTLVDQGLTRDEATELCAAYISAVSRPAASN